ncbi:MAG: hypothetical protein M1826_004405 [Phylliscum demangeonii]|nr:MAG: hypothetical protein M1826_004405 [Phylliscum demangeonii]
MTTATKRVPIPRNGVDYRGAVVLAPMVRSGELPTRLLALRYGADLVWGPETVDKAMIGTTRRVNPHTSTVEFVRWPSNRERARPSVIFALHPVQEDRRLIFQMGTASPELAVEAAKLVAADVAGIDVNAGCPKPFSTSGGMGAALLRTPDRLCAILEALVTQVGAAYAIGISVKIRLLETAEMTESLVRRLCATGITGLTVHCRMTATRPRERALRDQLPLIARLCRAHGVACVMNGDVRDRDDARQLMREYDVDGAMIATCAEANPSCFRTAADGGLVPWRELATEYLTTALAVDNKFGNTKFLLNQFIPGKQSAHRLVQACRSYADVVRALGVEPLAALAAEVDERLGLQLRPREAPVIKSASGAETAAAAGRRAGRQPGRPGTTRAHPISPAPATTNPPAEQAFALSV